MSICRSRFAIATNISLKRRSTICAAPAGPLSLLHWNRQFSSTSACSSTVRIAIDEVGYDGNAESRSVMFDFEQHLSELGTQTVLCVGDLMLDEFVYGEVSRISPEAPAQVIAVSRQETVIGGAGNVARNIASLGAHCLFVGVVGEDEPGRQLTSILVSEPGIDA